MITFWPSCCHLRLLSRVCVAYKLSKKRRKKLRRRSRPLSGRRKPSRQVRETGVNLLRLERLRVKLVALYFCMLLVGSLLLFLNSCILQRKWQRSSKRRRKKVRQQPKSKHDIVERKRGRTLEVVLCGGLLVPPFLSQSFPSLGLITRRCKR